MSTKSNTTGDLREFLFSSMKKVESGELECENARIIAKMAAHLNESFYAEIKIAKDRLCNNIKPDAIGKLLIGSK